MMIAVSNMDANTWQTLFNVVLLIAAGAVGFIFNSVFTRMKEMDQRLATQRSETDRKIDVVHGRISDGAHRTNEHGERLTRVESQYASIQGDLKEFKGLLKRSLLIAPPF